ncbi:transposase [Streptomyces sp. NPDC002669]|uniref:transposase n=1 Tax=Streptomyces sp. NPDC002669 TaxID=3364658 RepID=UPI0036B9D27B
MTGLSGLGVVRFPEVRGQVTEGRMGLMRGARMMPAPRKYLLELRGRGVRTYRTAEPKPVICRMAEELGVHHEPLRSWIRQAGADAGERDDMLITAEREELAACARRMPGPSVRMRFCGRPRLFRGPARPGPAG